MRIAGRMPKPLYETQRKTDRCGMSDLSRKRRATSGGTPTGIRPTSSRRTRATQALKAAPGGHPVGPVVNSSAIGPTQPDQKEAA